MTISFAPVLAAAFATLAYVLCGRAALPAWLCTFVMLLVFGVILVLGATLTVTIGR
jgi:hypothetical protein